MEKKGHCSGSSAAASSSAETDESEPPKKRRRISLSLSKRSKSRFAAPVEEEQVVEASKGVVPDNTKRRNNWALRNFSLWMENRNKQVPNDVVPEDILSCQDPAILNKWLCRYVLETRQENGNPYPPKSLNGLLCGIHRVTLDNKVPFNFLDKTSVHFQDLHKTLDSVCSELHSSGIGADTKLSMVISYEHEDLLWRHGALTYDNPRGLFHAVFFYVGLSFCLRGGQEQRDLVWSNFKRIPEDPQIYNEDTCYEYIEFASKNNQHRFSDIHLRNKCVKAYSSVGSVKCIVKILDCYKRRVPQEPSSGQHSC